MRLPRYHLISPEIALRRTLLPGKNQGPAVTGRPVLVYFPEWISSAVTPGDFRRLRPAGAYSLWPLLLCAASACCFRIQPPTPPGWENLLFRRIILAQTPVVNHIM
jgi:hypothetical protein